MFSRGTAGKQVTHYVDKIGVSAFSFALCMMAIYGFLAPVKGYAQSFPSSKSVGYLEVYKQVLDLVFPVDDLRKGGGNFYFVLRFDPAFEPESQIAIKMSYEHVEVVECMAMESVSDKVHAALSDSNDIDPAKIASSIVVNKRSLLIPHRYFKKWNRSFSRALSSTTKSFLKIQLESYATGYVSVVSDGTIYSLTYGQQKNVMSFVLYTAKEELPLVLWMEKIRKEVAAMK
jgi:hypothetical protein